MKHFIDRIDVLCSNRIASYGIKKPIYEPDPLYRPKWRIAAGIRQHACNRMPAERAHAIEVDLSFDNPARPPERFCLRIRADDSGRDRLRLRRERRLAPNRNSQSVPQCVRGRASLARLRLGTRACFRVGAVGAPLSNGGQDAGSPLTSPVSMSRNSTSSTSSIARRTAAPAASRCRSISRRALFRRASALASIRSIRSKISILLSSVFAVASSIVSPASLSARATSFCAPLFVLGRNRGREAHGPAPAQHVGGERSIVGALNHHRRRQMDRDDNPRRCALPAFSHNCGAPVLALRSDGETPRPYGVEPRRPRVEAVRIVDMSESNSWAGFAGLFCATRSAFLDHREPSPNSSP